MSQTPSNAELLRIIEEQSEIIETQAEEIRRLSAFVALFGNDLENA